MKECATFLDKFERFSYKLFKSPDNQFKGLMNVLIDYLNSTIAEDDKSSETQFYKWLSECEEQKRASELVKLIFNCFKLTRKDRKQRQLSDVSLMFLINELTNLENLIITFGIFSSELAIN